MEESALERGERLEEEAIEQFEKVTGKIVDRIGFVESEENEFMGFSPDGLIENNGFFTEAIEVKCLSSAKFIKAWIEDEIPEEHNAQIIQAFIVNEKLDTLYFVLYDPRVTVHPLHIINVTRESLLKEIEEYKTKELDFIKQINDKISGLLEIGF